MPDTATPLENIAHEDLRVLLWDIDGTLMRSHRRDAYKDYTVPVLENIFGTAGRLREMTVSGMTDLQIICEALREEGFTPAQVRERVEDLRTHYMEEMLRATENGSQGFHLLPGVREILEATHAHPRYLNSLLTGNLEPAAHLKMRLVGLSEFFSLPGAFGDDSHDRRDLPQLAVERISRHLKLELGPRQFIVIGDTPNDILCARHGRMHAVAVGTGRMYSKEDLMAHAPDAFLQDLADTAEVLRTFDSL
jgi:phosphoglycolate phosphatase